MKVKVLYDRTELVEKVIRSVDHHVLAGALLGIAVVFVSWATGEGVRLSRP